MSQARVALVASVVLVLAGAIVLWALQAEREPEAPPPPAKQPEPVVVAAETEVVAHPDMWPFGEFESELSRLRAETRPTELTEDPMRQNELKAYPTEVVVDLDEGTVEQLCEILTGQLAATKVKVFTYPSPTNENVRITLHFKGRVDKLLDEIQRATGGQVHYYMTSLGLTLGDTAAVQQCQWDDASARAAAAAERERGAPLVGVPFRPDFVDATVGSISRVVREQSGVEVVVDAETWRLGRKLTWRADPMPLREALTEICRKLDCVWRVRDGRVFLFRP